MALKLHLGCGNKYLPGYVNVDYPSTEHNLMQVKADVYADIRTLSYETGSVDEIRAHHVLEHFSRAEALALLAKWRGWLAPGGMLHLETPDFAACAWAYAATHNLTRRFQLGRHMFGSQEASWAYHYDFWDKQKFLLVLATMGFERVRVRQYANSLAQKFPAVPLLNLIGNMVPDRIFAKHSWHKLPNIEVLAKKSATHIDAHACIKAILSRSLVGSEGTAIMDEWLKQIGPHS